MNVEEATVMARDYVAEVEKCLGIPLKVIDSATIETSFGWVFHYDVDNNISDEIIAGNGPLIVDRTTGELHSCGSAHSTEYYIDSYERYGSGNIG